MFSSIKCYSIDKQHSIHDIRFPKTIQKRRRMLSLARPKKKKEKNVKKKIIALYFNELLTKLMNLLVLLYFSKEYFYGIFWQPKALILNYLVFS